MKSNTLTWQIVDVCASKWNLHCVNENRLWYANELEQWQTNERPTAQHLRLQARVPAKTEIKSDRNRLDLCVNFVKKNTEKSFYFHPLQFEITKFTHRMRSLVLDFLNSGCESGVQRTTNATTNGTTNGTPSNSDEHLKNRKKPVKYVSKSDNFHSIGREFNHTFNKLHFYVPNKCPIADADPFPRQRTAPTTKTDAQQWQRTQNWTSGQSNNWNEN